VNQASMVFGKSFFARKSPFSQLLVGGDRRKSKNNPPSCCVKGWEANFTRIEDRKSVRFNKLSLTCCQKPPGLAFALTEKLRKKKTKHHKIKGLAK